MEPVLQLDRFPWSSDYEEDTDEPAFRSVEPLVTKIMDDGIQQDPLHNVKLDMLRPAFANHLPVALMHASAHRVLLPMLGQPNRTEVKDDLPLYLPVAKNLRWRCGYPGHHRSACRKLRKMFCSRCGLSGVCSADC
ncbi:hypothetical protein JTB14_024348 [Gonioctena quinquepunctata]|nr:hypothetical protein JTB14_024348 [Gonioctena quinquepunctata]